jgi:hypothetical protein
VRLLGDATAAQGRVVTRPAMTAAAVWLQRHIGAADPRVPVAPAPGWLVTALRSPGPGARFQQPAQRRIPVGSVRGRLRGLLAVVLDSTPPAGDRKGNRNERLYWAACKAAEMVTAGELDQGTAVRVLTEAGESTGLGRGAVAATIASAMRGAGR